MINAEEIVSDVMKKLQKDDYFSDKKIVTAFTRAVKPTVMKQVYVACGLREINVENAAVGEYLKSGNVKIFAEIYVPWRITDFDMQKAVCKIAKCTEDMGISSVYAGTPYQDSDTQCIVQTVEFTFSDMLNFD